MALTKSTKLSQPLVEYRLSENSEELELLNNAFDILFEEMLRQNDNLTTNDN